MATETLGHQLPVSQPIMRSATSLLEMRRHHRSPRRPVISMTFNAVAHSQQQRLHMCTKRGAPAVKRFYSLRTGPMVRQRGGSEAIATASRSCLA